MDGVDRGSIMEMKDVLRALEWEADHAARNSGPCTARVIRGFIALLDRGRRRPHAQLLWLSPRLGTRFEMLERLDTGYFVTRMLAGEQPKGQPVFSSTRSSGNTFRLRRAAVMEPAGTQATREKPLAWVTAETNLQTFQHELRCRYWPGGSEEALLGVGHAHGAWVESFSPPLLSVPAAMSG